MWYSQSDTFATTAAQLRDEAPAGIILSGGPASVYEDGAPQLDPSDPCAGIPVLGICYGHAADGADPRRQGYFPAQPREYGRADMTVGRAGPALRGRQGGPARCG